MGNNNFPHGFRPLMIDTAGAPVGIREYAKPATDANAIFTWDLLQRLTGSAGVEGQPLPSPVVQTYSTGTPGITPIVGSSLNYGAPSKATWHTVVDDPYAIFEAQCDGAGSITVAADAGMNFNVNKTAQTNGTTLSAMQVNSATIAATANEDGRILDLSRNISNNEGANAIVEVLILNHFYSKGTAGV